MIILILKLLVTGLFFITLHGVEGVRSIPKEEDLELESQLKILNKSPIKTFHTEWGDVVDCVDIHKQPAFDHPLLKDHKIELNPSFPEELRMKQTPETNEPNASLSGIMSQGLHCPEGTVPIRRKSKDDLLRVKTLSKNSNAAVNQFGSVINLAEPGHLYYATNARINVYNPKVKADQFSAAQLWVMKGEQFTPKNEVLEAGWIVSPEVNGDTRTRLFGYWTADGFNQTGCWNTLCPGFVQTHKSIHIDAPIEPTSVYGGTQHAIDLLIIQGPETGNWWLKLGGQIIGYWPKALFKSLSDGADFLSWGGHVKAGIDNVSPPMGSGHMPDSCFMSHVQYGDRHDTLIDLNNTAPLQTYVSCPRYSLTKRGYVNPSIGFEIQFGGPGGVCNP